MVQSQKTPVLYQDQKWIVVNKPTGLSTQSAHPGDLGVGDWLKLHLNIETHIFSRLDKGTSGVLIMALTPQGNTEAQKIHKQNLTKKTYLFISDKKHVGLAEWTCKEAIQGSPCETHFYLEKTGHNYFLYRAEIVSGKTHQIRRHAAFSGTPILGDTEYRGTVFSRLCLHCSQVIWSGVDRPLKAPMPDSFAGLLAGKNRLWIEAAVAHERRLYWLSPITNAFRAVHRGEIEKRPFAIDVFSDWMCVTGFDETISASTLKKQIEPVLDLVSGQYACKGGIIKTHQQNPHQKKLCRDITCWGAHIPNSFLIKEHDLFYEVSLNGDQHVGLFLDQRDSRRRLSLVVKEKRVANLFAFTCSFSTVAAKAGAEIVFSVDLAAGCLERGKQNFEHNKLTTLGRGKFIQEDVRTWLARQLRQKKTQPGTFSTWDFIICDPPVFAVTGQGHSFSVQKMWPELAQNVSEILSKQGIALFANNHRHGNSAFYLDELKKRFSSVIPLSPPLDFPELPDMPTHVRIYWCQRS